jgi:hypothetical protein
MLTMPSRFISESIYPVEGTFDTARMAAGEPGVPGKFRWRDREIIVAQVLESWKEHGDCTHGSGERYVRKHGYRILTTDGEQMKIYFQRKFGKVQRKYDSRWWLFSLDQG